jgi:hypothetical protein
MLLSKFSPNDFRTDRHLWDTFGNAETETSALWVLMFLQARGSGWAPFTVGEMQAFYGRERRDRFAFNQLIAGSHRHMTAASFPLGELRNNDAVIEVVPPDGGHQFSDDAVCTVTEKFVARLVRNGSEHLKARTGS